MNAKEQLVSLSPDVGALVSKSLRDAYACHLSAGSLKRRARAVARDALRTERLSCQRGALVDEIARKVVERRGAEEDGDPTLKARVERHVVARYVEEIERRGGETGIEEERNTVPVKLLRRSACDRLALLGADGWRHYSRSFGARRASLRYLCGIDDNGPWAVRVPGTVDSIGDAFDWLEPAAVRQARDRGLRVLRQGDVYVVERLRGGDDFRELPESHSWNPVTRYLTHRPEDGRKHRPLRVPFLARVYVQRAFEMGRSARRGAFAD